VIIGLGATMLAILAGLVVLVRGRREA
jgi:hypothetical protein